MPPTPPPPGNLFHRIFNFFAQLYRRVQILALPQRSTTECTCCSRIRQKRAAATAVWVEATRLGETTLEALGRAPMPFGVCPGCKGCVVHSLSLFKTPPTAHVGGPDAGNPFRSPSLPKSAIMEHVVCTTSRAGMCKHRIVTSVMLRGGAGPDDASEELKCTLCGVHGWRYIDGSVSWSFPPVNARVHTTKEMATLLDGDHISALFRAALKPIYNPPAGDRWKDHAGFKRKSAKTIQDELEKRWASGGDRGFEWPAIPQQAGALGPHCVCGCVRGMHHYFNSEFVECLGRGRPPIPKPPGAFPEAFCKCTGFRDTTEYVGVTEYDDKVRK